MRGRSGETYFVDQGQAATRFVGAALTVAALQAGGEMVSRPCRPVLVQAAGERSSLHAKLERLHSARVEPGRCGRIVSAAGIAGVDLGALRVPMAGPQDGRAAPEAIGRVTQPRVAGFGR